jgi:hypothetical protein
MAETKMPAKWNKKKSSNHIIESVTLSYKIKTLDIIRRQINNVTNRELPNSHLTQLQYLKSIIHLLSLLSGMGYRVEYGIFGGRTK